MYKAGNCLNKLNFFFLQNDLCVAADWIQYVVPLRENVGTSVEIP
jgi:hypothetical protein